jgi:drug/metabolite transporter (DMT)-like permease
MMFLAGLRTVAPVQATLTAMLEPVLATAFAWVLLGEALRFPQLIGGVLIITAVASLQVSRARMLEKRPDSEVRRSPLAAES